MISKCQAPLAARRSCPAGEARGGRSRRSAALATRTAVTCSRQQSRNSFGRSHLERPTAWTGRRRPAEAVPRRGWTSWTLEMAHSLISMGLLEIISNRHAENAKRPGRPPFSDVQGHFHGDGCRSDGWKWRPACRRVDASSDKASSVDSHPVEPTLAAWHRLLHRRSRTVSPVRGQRRQIRGSAFGIGRGRRRWPAATVARLCQWLRLPSRGRL